MVSVFALPNIENKDVETLEQMYHRLVKEKAEKGSEFRLLPSKNANKPQKIIADPSDEFMNFEQCTQKYGENRFYFGSDNCVTCICQEIRNIGYLCLRSPMACAPNSVN
ncbi:hypothetical protein BB561_004674 [Smittium simulii]|uniref:Uncharacterized protein n=1 Tax=Smittium simulii TaxID=133385 RepID=A0A2T9YEV5_9FUNG|nr:hypothetical protein BB561_004674 [Smittium simulii]